MKLYGLAKIFRLRSLKNHERSMWIRPGKIPIYRLIVAIMIHGTVPAAEILRIPVTLPIIPTGKGGKYRTEKLGIGTGISDSPG